MPGLSREDQIILGVGVVSALTIAVIGYAVSRQEKPAPKKDYGLRVGAQCASHEFKDTAKIKETISVIIDQQAAQGAVDPFSVTTQWLRRAAGACKAYPEQTRNPGEAELYWTIFNQVVELMKEKQLISEDMLVTYVEMIDLWAKAQGVEIQEVPV
jgi:hypothetical protein